MSDMKLIMENWRGYLSEADLDPCPKQPIDLGEFKVALDIASSDSDIQKQKIEKLKKQKGRIKNLGKILAAANFLAAIPALNAAAGLSFAAGLVTSLAYAMKQRQENKQDNKISALLGLLCIDDDLLDILDNRIEKEYWSNSDIQSQISNYVNSADPSEPMPNFTQHFLEWLNNQSEYAVDSASTPNTKVVEK